MFANMLEVKNKEIFLILICEARILMIPKTDKYIIKKKYID